MHLLFLRVQRLIFEHRIFIYLIKNEQRFVKHNSDLSYYESRY